MSILHQIFIANSISAAIATFIPTATPAAFTDVGLFLRGDGNVGDTNTITDTSTYNNAVTLVGKPVIGRNSPWSQSYYSLEFNGGTDGISTPNAVAVAPMGTAAWGLDLFVIFNHSNIGYQPLVVNSNGADGTGFSLAIEDSNRLVFRVSSTNAGWTTTLATTWTPTPGKNHHLYVSRSTTTIAIYADGTRLASAAILSTLAYTPPTLDKFYIGTNPYAIGGAISFSGRMHAIRFKTSSTFGVGATYTVPTNITTSTGYSFITGYTARFKEGSTNNRPLTLTGTPKVVNGSPIMPTYSYFGDISGGSCYFNGTTDALTCNSGTSFNFGTSAFSIASFVYPVETKADNTIYGDQDSSGNNGSISLFINENNFVCASWWTSATTKVTQVSSLSVIPNQWNNVAITRNASGPTLYFNVNGVCVSYAAILPATIRTGTKPFIGRAGQDVSTNKYFSGYVGSFTISKAVGNTAATYAIATAPATVSTQTLFLYFNNSKIVDYSNRNNLFLNNSVGFSNAFVKYNTSSIDLTGNKNLSIVTNNNVLPGKRTFTLRTWVYKNTNSSPSTFDATGVLFRQYISDTQCTVLQTTSAGNLQLNVNGNIVFTTIATVPVDKWTHVSIVRADTSIFVFIDNILVFSKNISVDLSIGTPAAFTEIGNVNGVSGQSTYIDDYCLTYGNAQYVSSYSTPSKLLYGQVYLTQNSSTITVPTINTVSQNQLVSTASIIYTNIGDVSVRNAPVITNVSTIGEIYYVNNTGSMGPGVSNTLDIYYSPTVKGSVSDTVNAVFNLGTIQQTLTANVSATCNLNIKVFNYTGTLDTSWVVPKTATYLICATGGSTPNNGYGAADYGGAYMLATSNLNSGTATKVAVGQGGWNTGGQTFGAGGTFLTTSSNTPIMVAGGSGGSQGNYSGSVGVVANRGTQNGGTNVPSASNLCYNGAGLRGNGLGYGANSTAYAFANGAAGNPCFGGGNQYGGGGGYDGGNGYYDPGMSWQTGDGGTSYTNGTLINGVDGGAYTVKSGTNLPGNSMYTWNSNGRLVIGWE